MNFQAALYVLAALVAATLAITTADIRDDLRFLDTQTRQLDNAINRLQNVKAGRSKFVSAIHIDILDLGNAWDQATSETKEIRGHITENDGLSILTGLQTLKSTTLNTLKDLVAKKAVLISLGFRDAVLQSLKNLQSSTLGFEDALIATAPADLKNRLIAVKKDLHDGFDGAIDQL